MMLYNRHRLIVQQQTECTLGVVMGYKLHNSLHCHVLVYVNECYIIRLQNEQKQ